MACSAYFLFKKSSEIIYYVCFLKFSHPVPRSHNLHMQGTLNCYFNNHFSSIFRNDPPILRILSCLLYNSVFTGDGVQHTFFGEYRRADVTYPCQVISLESRLWIYVKNSRRCLALISSVGWV